MRGWHLWTGLLLALGVEAALLLDWREVTVWATPLAWWGLILFADGYLQRRQGRSPLLGRPRRLLGWCVFSVLSWLVFEAYNLHLGNWHYLNLPSATAVRLAGYLLSYATIVPGVFLVVEIVAVGGWPPEIRGPRIAGLRGGGLLLSLAGAALLTIPLLLDEGRASNLFALVWLGFFLLLDPWNLRLGLPSVLGDLREGRYTRTLRMLLAGLLCGFLWESWNTLAATRWVYTVPFTASPRIWEMPLLGFLGFPPFVLELFAMYHLAAGAWRALFPGEAAPPTLEVLR